MARGGECGEEEEEQREGGLSARVSFSFSQPSLPSTHPPHHSSSWAIRYFVARANKLTGPLPASLATSANLMTLDVRNNSLSSLPTEWVTGWPGAPTSSLVNVRVSFNALEGSFPAALGACPGLTFLTVNNNSLSGDLPAPDASFPALRALNASFNAFSGPIPDAWLSTGLFTLPPLNLGLGGVGLVHVFDVSRNVLSGAVPPRLLGTPPPPPTPVDVYVAGNPGLEVACPAGSTAGGAPRGVIRVDACGGPVGLVPPQPTIGDGGGAGVGRAAPADVSTAGKGRGVLGGLPPGAIAGIVAASLLAATAAVSLGVALVRRRPKPSFDAGGGGGGGSGGAAASPAANPSPSRTTSGGFKLGGGAGGSRGFQRFEDAPGVELASARPPA